jgi:RNA polymerase sigma-70 factor, ECF subfamily
MMDEPDTNEQFVGQLTEHQNRIYGYVYSLLGDHSRAADVVQETNLVLWRKIDEFQPDRPFLPWAFAIARFQVMACLRDRKRDRLLLDAELVEVMSDEVERKAEQLDAIRAALRHCLQALSTSNRDLVDRRYYRGMSLATVSAATDRSIGSIKVALLRIRQQLAECVQKRLTAED